MLRAQLTVVVLVTATWAIRAQPPEPKVIALEHRTLDFHAEGCQRFELSGSISDGAGKGKLRRTGLANPDTRNVFGDRIGEAPKDAKTTEHDITLELLRNESSGVPSIISDPSPAKDRSLYIIKGVDLGVNRSLLLMVSAKGPQRLIYLGRCGGVWAATLEPMTTFDGPAPKEK